MMLARTLRLAVFLFSAAAVAIASAAEEKTFKRTEDVIYGRKYGVALTMDVFTPPKPNGTGIIFVVSGGWFSAHEVINVGFFRPVLDRGYTVFAVVHGSQPKFSIPEILGDMHRAVRYIRHHASDYKVDPDRLGIMGGSAGGHLSLMQGTAGSEGDPKAADPVDRESSRVQAVACFFPPTDFLNYGKEGEIGLGRGVLKDFRAPFDFEEMSSETKRLVEITDEAKILEIGKQISPITHASGDDPPALIIHGDADELVPIQQAKLIVDKLKAAGVEAELITKPGAGHGWADFQADMEKFADWFDEHLAVAKQESAADDGADFELEEGFERLFNGKDLTGWGYRVTPVWDLKKISEWKARDPNMPPWPIVTEPVTFDGETESLDSRYVAKDGVIVVTEPEEGRKIQQMWTTREFDKDFVLRLEFRASKNADSGVFIRAPQLQCRDYLVAGPYKDLKKYRPQKWNELEVTVKDGSARATCNGEVLEEEMEVPETGPIGLEGDRGQMEYRRIRVREM
jgi:acetyl esterase/lipase